MIYPKYEKYKDSGVLGIDVIPEQWEVWKITHGFNLIGSGTTPKSDNLDYYNGNTPWVTTSELRENIIYDTEKKLTPDAVKDCSALHMFNKGALVIAMYGATIGRLGILGLKACVNQACCVFDQPKIFEPRFIFWWFHMAKPILISQSSGGGQPNLNQDLLKQLRVPVPVFSEQKSIVEFLDKKTAKIDVLIAKKQELLKLLTEKRTALITQVVTKGLDSNVPMKDSKFLGFGMLPKEWDIKKVKHIVRFAYGDSLPAEQRVNGVYSVYGSNGPVGIHETKNTLSPAIIIGRKGSFGKLHYIDKPGLTRLNSCKIKAFST